MIVKSDNGQKHDQKTFNKGSMALLLAIFLIFVGIGGVNASNITCYADFDGDSFTNNTLNYTDTTCSAANYTSINTTQDCNDSNASINPNAIEICNGVDDNCDGQTDEGNVCPTISYYCDNDSDSYISKTISGTCNTYNCIPLNCTITQGNDCNDTTSSINPNATETCNNIDDNCNSQTDENLQQFTYFIDADIDNYGNTTNNITTCSSTPPQGYTTNNTDCNDNNNQINPGATDIPNNNIDENCNNHDNITCYADLDNDTYTNNNNITYSDTGSCPANYTNTSTTQDCNDTYNNIHPNAADILNNNIDEDCNGYDNITCYADLDNDTYTNNSNVIYSNGLCPTNYTNTSTTQDCNDNNINIHPGATEIYGNVIDENCDGITYICGDGYCNNGEGCSSCHVDCGACSESSHSYSYRVFRLENSSGKYEVLSNMTFMTDLCADKNIIGIFPYGGFTLFLDGHKAGYTDKSGIFTFKTTEGKHNLWFVLSGNRQEYNITVKNCSQVVTEITKSLHIIRPSQSIIKGNEFTILAVDESKHPVENVKITYENQIIYTDEDGKVTFIAIRDGNYDITATKGDLRVVSQIEIISKQQQNTNNTNITMYNSEGNTTSTCVKFIDVCWYWWLFFIFIFAIFIIIWKFYLEKK